MSQEYNITADNLRAQNFRPIHAGDDYDHQFAVERPPGTALDLTGAKIWLTVKADPVETDVQAKLQLDSSDNTQIEITDATAGNFTVKFRGSGLKSTEDLEGLWRYDIQVKLGAPSNTVITVAFGLIEFLENITRSTV